MDQTPPHLLAIYLPNFENTSHAVQQPYSRPSILALRNGLQPDGDAISDKTICYSSATNCPQTCISNSCSIRPNDNPHNSFAFARNTAPSTSTSGASNAPTHQDALHVEIVRKRLYAISSSNAQHLKTHDDAYAYATNSGQESPQTSNSYLTMRRPSATSTLM
jgi:hypothetical protein